jgi:hypothetical protein
MKPTAHHHHHHHPALHFPTNSKKNSSNASPTEDNSNCPIQSHYPKSSMLTTKLGTLKVTTTNEKENNPCIQNSILKDIMNVPSIPSSLLIS